MKTKGNIKYIYEHENLKKKNTHQGNEKTQTCNTISQAEDDFRFVDPEVIFRLIYMNFSVDF